jgi:hypothetical protein
MSTDSTGSERRADRRESDRRNAPQPFNGDERRAAQRRSGDDRRRAPRVRLES